jgi:hypothetical protein
MTQLNARTVALTALLFVAPDARDATPTASQSGTAALTARSAAQIDLTGYWVSIVTQDWVYRMLSPPKGDMGSVPLNSEGKKQGEDWDSEADHSVERRCRAYGAAGIMRQPGRIHIEWKDDTTLQMDFDAGTQTRLLHFAEFLPPSGFATSQVPLSLLRVQPPRGLATRQGYSVAAWHKVAQIKGLTIVGMNSTPPPTPNQGGSLMIITTHMTPGYLQKNGVPYSEDAVLTEYFDRIHLPNGDDYLVETSIVEDPTYLTEPYVTSTQFKKEHDGRGWAPTRCDTQ